MKKNKLLLFVALFALCGCDKKNSSAPAEEKSQKSFNLHDVVMMNLSAFAEEGSEEDEVHTKLVEKKEFLDETEVESLGRGILRVKNPQGKVGFYSMPHGKYIVEPVFDENMLVEYGTSDVSSSNYVGSFLKIRYKENTYLFDGFGNLIGSSVYSDGEYKFTAKYGLTESFTQAFASDEVDAQTSTFAGKSYVDVILYGEHSCLGYTKKGVPFGISSPADIPDEEDDSSLFPEVIDEESYLDFGDDYVDPNENRYVDLTDYGLPGYHLSVNSKNGNYWTVFNAKGEKVFSQAFPAGTQKFVADGILYYQEAAELPEDAAEFDYSSGLKKYSLFTHRVELKTGENTLIEFPYLINNGASLKDESGIFNYIKLTCRHLESYKELSPETREIVFDAELKVLKDTTEYFIGDFVQLDENHFYNKQNKIIYDKDLKETLYIGSLNPEYVASENIFIGMDNGKYGAIDPDGKVVIPFKFAQIKKGIKTGKYVFKDHKALALGADGSWYRISPVENYEEYLGTAIEHIYDDCYFFSDDTNFVVADYDTNYVESTVKDSSYFMKYSHKIGLGDSDYFFIVNGTDAYTFAKKEVVNKEEFASCKEIDAEGQLVDNYYYGAVINKGEQTILVAQADDTSYFKLPSKSEDTVYELNVNKSCIFYFLDSEGEVVGLPTVGKKVTKLVEAGTVQYLQILHDITWPYSVMNIELECIEYHAGEHELLPLEYETLEQVKQFEVSKDVHKYIVFEPNETATYEVKAEGVKLPTFRFAKTTINNTISSTTTGDFTRELEMTAGFTYFVELGSADIDLSTFSFSIAKKGA